MSITLIADHLGMDPHILDIAGFVESGDMIEIPARQGRLRFGWWDEKNVMTTRHDSSFPVVSCEAVTAFCKLVVTDDFASFCRMRLIELVDRDKASGLRVILLGKGWRKTQLEDAVAACGSGQIYATSKRILKELEIFKPTPLPLGWLKSLEKIGVDPEKLADASAALTPEMAPVAQPALPGDSWSRFRILSPAGHPALFLTVGTDKDSGFLFDEESGEFDLQQAINLQAASQMMQVATWRAQGVIAPDSNAAEMIGRHTLRVRSILGDASLPGAGEIQGKDYAYNPYRIRGRAQFHQVAATFLELFMPDPRDHAFLLRWLSSLTSLSEPLPAFFLWGEPNNGKSMFLAGVAGVFGGSMNYEDFAHADFREPLLRTPCIIGEEITVSGKKAAAEHLSLIKSSTTGATLTVNLKHRPAVIIREARLRFVFAANDQKMLASLYRSVKGEAISLRAFAMRVMILKHNNCGEAVRSLLISSYSQTPSHQRQAAFQRCLTEHFLWLCEHRKSQEEAEASGLVNDPRMAVLQPLDEIIGKLKTAADLGGGSDQRASAFVADIGLMAESALADGRSGRGRDYVLCSLARTGRVSLNQIWVESNAPPGVPLDEITAALIAAGWAKEQVRVEGEPGKRYAWSRTLSLPDFDPREDVW